MVSRVLSHVARRATARAGADCCSQSIVSRWRHEISVSLLRRRAAISRSTLPRRSDRDLWMLSGAVDGEAASCREGQLDDFLAGIGPEDVEPAASVGAGVWQ